MKQLRITNAITKCWDCPFHEREQGGVMYCGHPHFTDPYGGYIISQDNMNVIPLRCPLRTSEVVTTVRLK